MSEKISLDSSGLYQEHLLFGAYKLIVCIYLKKRLFK